MKLLNILCLSLCFASFIMASEGAGRVEPLFKDGKYANPFPSQKVSSWNAFKAHFGNKNLTRPLKFLPADSVDLKKALPEGQAGLHVTWLGHSSFLMQIDGVRLLIDPVFSNNISPVPLLGIKRFQEKSPVGAEELPFIDAVFISHNHRDHLDRRTIESLIPKAGFFIAPLGVGEVLREWGIDSARVKEYGWWQEDSIKGLSGQVLKFACAPARHFSGRSLFDWNKTLWSSWVFIGSGGHRVFYSGDTAYGFHFGQIGNSYGPFDLALIENGQYSVNWPDKHLMPEDGVKACMELKCRYMIPVHWGSFNLSIHDWREPIERASKEAREKGVALLTPRIGQTLSIDENPVTQSWWKSY